MTRGYYRMARGWMDHPMLKSREPFSKREAWCWLIETAAYKPQPVRKGSATTLNRGQLSFSLRFIGAAWDWDHGRVRRFLNGLANEEMVELKTDESTGQTRITICNYDKYQHATTADETGDETPDETGQRTGPRTNKKERNNPKNLKKGKKLPSGATRAREAQQFDRANQGRLLIPINGGLNPSQRSNHNGQSELPLDWWPNGDDREYAANRGHDEQWTDEQAELFRNHYHGHGESRKNWSATWRKWVQRDAQFTNGAGAARSARPGNNGLAAAVDELFSDWQVEFQR